MTEHLFTPGHTACAGCGQALTVRLAGYSMGGLAAREYKLED